MIKEFVKIGTIPKHGTSAIAQAYVWADMQPLTGNSYYRLKQIDLDGKFTFSQVRSISRPGINSVNFLLYPNPVKDLASINFLATQQAKGWIKLVDMSGKEVLSKSVHWESGAQQVNISLQEFKAGNYILMLFDGQKSYSTKFTKE